MTTKTQTRVIKIVVDTSKAKGLDTISKKMGTLNKKVKNIDNSMSSLKTAFLGIFAGVGIRAITRAADEFQLLQDRIKVFAGSTEAAKAAFDDIIQASKELRAPITTIAEGYNRIAIATKDLGLNSDEILGVTAALQQTLRLSGASAQEASSTFLQFSQALSLGRLQGQELRAVLLSNGVFAKILAKEFKATTGELRALGEQGKLTASRALSALAKEFKRLNADASQLNITFEQGMIILLDALKVKVKDLNDEFKASRAFGDFVKIAIKNIDLLGAAFAGLGVIIAVKVIPSIIAGLSALKVALLGNPVTAILVGVTTVATALYLRWDEVTSFMSSAWAKVHKSILEGAIGIQTALLDLSQSGGIIGKLLKPFVEGESFRKGLASNLKSLGAIIKKETDEITKGSEKGAKGLSDLQKALLETGNKLKDAQSTVTKGPFYELNKELKIGKKSLEEYEQAISNLKITDLTKKFEAGKVTLEEYNNQLSDLKVNVDSLDKKGAFFAGLGNGARKVYNSIGTLAQEISKGVQNAFSGLEDSLFDFIKTGKLSFKAFTQTILDELTRIIIRSQIIKPLADVVAKTFNLKTSANGNAFQGGNVIPFANGGVVNSPVIFPLSGGTTGLAGEAGPEAIVPLKRGSNGKLGVGAMPTVVNVYNQSSDTETRTEERENSDGSRSVDVFIVNKVNKAIGEGRFDKSFGMTYGLSRRGV